MIISEGYASKVNSMLTYIRSNKDRINLRESNILAQIEDKWGQRTYLEVGEYNALLEIIQNIKDRHEEENQNVTASGRRGAWQ